MRPISNGMFKKQPEESFGNCTVNKKDREYRQKEGSEIPKICSVYVQLKP